MNDIRHSMPHGIRPSDPDGNSVRAAARLLGGSLETGGGITFPYDPTLEDRAIRWAESVFVPLLAPAFLDAAFSAVAGRAGDVLEIDARLEIGLPPGLARSSALAGFRLAGSIAPLRGDRILKKLCARIAERSTPGHAVVVFAARAAVFSVAPRPALAAYLITEISASLSDPGPPVVSQFVSDCLARLPAPAPRLHAA